jgi:hypothetical protein
MKKLIAAAGLGAALAVAPLAAAGTASAYTSAEYNFLQLQASHGYLVYEFPQLYVRTAYWVCDRLNYETGDYLVPELLAGNPDRTYQDEATFMWDSVNALCPWHDHRTSSILQRMI